MAEQREPRLTVCCPDEAARAGIVARVNRAAVEVCPDPAQFRPGAGELLMLVGAFPDGVESILAAGTHVLLVAEPVPDHDSLEALFATAQSAGVQFVVANPDRYPPSRQLIRRQIPDTLGEPGLIRLHHWVSSSTFPAPLRDLDVTLWLAGRRPDRVYAVAPDSGRYVQVHLGFPGGGMALLDFDGSLPSGDGYQSLSVIAANGAAYADDHQNVQLAFRGGHPQAIRTDEQAGQLAAISQEFVDAIRDGRDLMTENVASWRNVFAVADAVRKSLATGRAVGVEAR